MPKEYMQQEYGRAYNQRRMLNLALVFVVDETAHYKPEQWENGLEVLRGLYGHLLRRDAVYGFDEDENEVTGDESIHSIQTMENLFHFQQVFSLLGCQQAFRAKLGNENETGKPEINEDIKKKLM
jgi:hypothetical protein